MNELEEVAKIAGILVRTDGKVNLTKFNRSFSRLGYDKVNRETLIGFMQEVEEDKTAYEIYEMALAGDVELEDAAGEIHESSSIIPSVNTEIINREFNKAAVRNYKKAQRDGAIQEGLSQMVADRLAEELVKVAHTDFNRPIVPVDSEKELVIALSDWHIGATVKYVNGNNYSVAIAESRLDEVLSEALEAIDKNDIKHVYVIHAGDFTEHVSMRNVNQAFDAEIDMAEQIAKANRMLVDFIREVADHTELVTVGLVGGNHDRYTPNKKEAIYNDNVAYNMVDSLIMLDEYGVLGNNVEIIDNRHDVYSVEFKVYDKVVRVVHGDNLSNNDKPKIPVMIKDHPIDYVFFGHYHSSKIIQENGSATGIMVGSLQGNNTYSKQLNLPDSKASQTLVLFDKFNQDSPMYNPIYLD